MRVLFAPAAVVPRADRRAALVPYRSDAARPGPTDPGDADLVDVANISAAWATSTSARPGANPAPIAIVTSALFAFGSSARIASIASCSSSLETNGTPAAMAAVTTAWSTPAGSAHATTSMPSGIGSPGAKCAPRPSHRARRRPWPCGRRRCRPAAPRRCPGCRPVGGRHACRPRRHRRRGLSPELGRLELAPAAARRRHAALAAQARDQPHEAGHAEDEQHAAEDLHGAGVYRAASAFDSARARARDATLVAFPGL